MESTSLSRKELLINVNLDIITLVELLPGHVKMTEHGAELWVLVRVSIKIFFSSVKLYVNSNSFIEILMNFLKDINP